MAALRGDIRFRYLKQFFLVSLWSQGRAISADIGREFRPLRLRFGEPCMITTTTAPYLVLNNKHLLNLV